jgi:hypothetical protein
MLLIPRLIYKNYKRASKFIKEYKNFKWIKLKNYYNLSYYYIVLYVFCLKINKKN